MIEDAVLITISCALFTNMGLSDAIQKVLRVKVRLLSCPKCLAFWANLLWLSFHSGPSLQCVAVSFISSYAALWITLIYDALSVLYNYAYEKISETDANPEGDTPDAVSKM